jgi:hypothetical protein
MMWYLADPKLNATSLGRCRNKAKAMKVLRARLYEAKRARAAAATNAERTAQAGTAERNERIRTYNFAQNRLTDHRVGMTHHGLEDVMSGAKCHMWPIPHLEPLLSVGPCMALSHQMVMPFECLLFACWCPCRLWSRSA